MSNQQLKYIIAILGLQSISPDAENNGSHPRRLDPTMELITYSFVLHLQHGRRGVKCIPSIDRKQSGQHAHVAWNVNTVYMQNMMIQYLK